MNLGVGVPVLCVSSTHVMIERPNAVCCDSADAFGLDGRGDLDAQALNASAGCGDCIDIPLLATGRLRSASATLDPKVFAFVPPPEPRQSASPETLPEISSFVRYDRGSPLPLVLSSVPLRC
jgi:hypothetical protein